MRNSRGSACLALSIAVLVTAAGLASGASAETLTSAYTSFDTRSCRKARGSETGTFSWTCRGLPGLPVRISLDDERMQVSFGPQGPENLASSQTFPAFNDVHSGRIEWRLRDGKPFATILRWNVMTARDVETATGPTIPSGHVLVVTRLGPGGACHVGYVDTTANRDANALARRVADERAVPFRCGTDKAASEGVVTPGLAMPYGTR